MSPVCGNAVILLALDQLGEDLAHGGIDGLGALVGKHFRLRLSRVDVGHHQGMTAHTRVLDEVDGICLETIIGALRRALTRTLMVAQVKILTPR